MTLAPASLALLSLLAATDPGVTVTETRIPMSAITNLEITGLDFAGSGGGLPKDVRLDKQAREVSAGGCTYHLEIEHINTETPGEAYLRYLVTSKGTAIYEFSEPLGPSDVWSFYANGDEWILETRTRVIVSGVDIASVHGLDEVAHYRLLGDRPVFLARQGPTYRLMTDRGPAAEYDQIYYHLCCDPAILNPRYTGTKVSFFATRGDNALFVEVTPTE